MKRLPALAAFALIFISAECNCQNSLSAGIKVGFGAPIIPAHPKFESNGVPAPVQNNPSLLQGFSAQYMISNLIGVETGVQMLYQSYTINRGRSYLYNFLAKGPTILVIDYQFPIIFMYNIEHPFNVKRHFKIVAGTTIDWLTTDFVIGYRPVQSLYNSVIGFRIVTDKLTSRREFSIEHQYSFRRFADSGMNYDQTQDHIDSRISVLTVSMTWFFAIKHLDRNATVNDL